MSDCKIKPLRPSGLTVYRAEKIYALLKELGEHGKLRGGCDGMRKRLKEALSVREKALFLTATIGPRYRERIVGTGAFYCQPTASGWLYFIKDIAVDKSYRRNGIGSEIVLRLLDHAKDVTSIIGNGSVFVHAEAKPGQKAAGQFFEGMGFQVESLAVGTKRNPSFPVATRYIIEISRESS